MYPVCPKEGRCVIWSAEIERSKVIHHKFVCDMGKGFNSKQNNLLQLLILLLWIWHSAEMKESGTEEQRNGGKRESRRWCAKKFFTHPQSYASCITHHASHTHHTYASCITHHTSHITHTHHASRIHITHHASCITHIVTVWQMLKKKLILCHVTSGTPVTLVTWKTLKF